MAQIQFTDASALVGFRSFGPPPAQNHTFNIQAKGAWNQKRIDREVVKLVEAAKREAAQKVGERTVGRPKGRKNDKTLEKAAREKVMALIRAEQERLQRDENDV